MKKSYDKTVVLSVEQFSLNPVEEDISNEAYSAKVPSFSLDEFEKLFSKSINDNELLMGIKLSNDQARIFKFLGNPNITESLFVKLLMLYEWQDEDEDNRNDRDVIMYTLRRYIDIKPNETDLLYSYLTLRRLATESTNPKLLLALTRFQNFTFLIRGKEKVTLQEAIARNIHIDQEVIKRLIGFRRQKINIALACNHCVDLELLEALMAKNSEDIHEALATNNKISDTLFLALLEKKEKTIQYLLLLQNINKERLDLIDNCNFEAQLFATLGANESLESTVIDRLICRENEMLICHLAANKTLSLEQLNSIYTQGWPISLKYLALNPSMSEHMLRMIYEKHKDPEVILALAHNTSTPEGILRELFARDEFDIYKSMASNSSVPIELLDVLKVDTRLQNELAQNQIFVREYETVLDYDKKSVQF